MKKLGKTIGIYGDSYGVRPYKQFDGAGIKQTPYSLHKDLEQSNTVERLRYNYLRDIEDFAVPKDNTFSNLSWWTYQISKFFDKPIHYGYSGTSVEHMLFSQIDVNNDFETAFPESPSAKNIVPDVMICLWTDPWRHYFDPIQSDFGFSYSEISDANQIGSPTLFHNVDNHIKKLSEKLKNTIEISSPFVLHQKINCYKLMFDLHWSQKLKKKNPKCKIIHIDCFNNTSHMKDYLPFKHNLWINNFSLDVFKNETDIAQTHTEWEKHINHFQEQKQHDFVTNKLVEWIEQYDDIQNKTFDFSSWKAEYEML